jgi:hypothetical protein
MSRDRRKSGVKKPDGRLRPRTAGRKLFVVAGAVIVVVVTVGAALLASRDRKPPAASVASAPIASSDGKPEVKRLVGNWVRPDGGYILGVRTVDSAGHVEAAYFNPRPIHVARASTSPVGNTMKLFIELRDEGYPGCTYDLTYNPEDDMLQGIYFQAQIQQRFDVVFLRMEGAGS